jgi:hypothetical protein
MNQSYCFLIENYSNKYLNQPIQVTNMLKIKSRSKHVEALVSTLFIMLQHRSYLTISLPKKK